MLIVLTCSPVTAPLEASLSKETETEVFVINLIGEIPGAVAICLGGGWLDEERAVINTITLSARVLNQVHNLEID